MISTRMPKVYFFQRPSQRQRQRETVEFCPAGIQPLTPPGIAFMKDTDITRKNLSRGGQIRAKLLRACVPINLRPITDPQVKDADLVYTWGDIPFRVSKPYVVELDTPYVLTLYNLFWLAVMRPVLRRLLLHSRCRGIVCISEACKQTLRSELGDCVASKARVVYPYMADHTERRRGKTGETVEFLFVSTNFYLKGGRETLHAFERLAAAHPDAHLTVVSNTPPEILERYGGAAWVTFVEANMEKEALFRRCYDRADVFVLPTYQDSFGLVFLEAVSFGLPVIATRLYAVPEMVEHGKNGLLLDPPFRHYTQEGRAVNANWNRDLAARIRQESYPAVENALYEALSLLMETETRAAMADCARARFRAKFARAARDEAFRAAVGCPQ